MDFHDVLKDMEKIVSDALRQITNASFPKDNEKPTLSELQDATQQVYDHLYGIFTSYKTKTEESKSGKTKELCDELFRTKSFDFKKDKKTKLITELGNVVYSILKQVLKILRGFRDFLQCYNDDFSLDISRLDKYISSIISKKNKGTLLDNGVFASLREDLDDMVKEFKEDYDEKNFETEMRLNFRLAIVKAFFVATAFEGFFSEGKCPSAYMNPFFSVCLHLSGSRIFFNASIDGNAGFYHVVGDNLETAEVKGLFESTKKFSEGDFQKLIEEHSFEINLPKVKNEKFISCSKELLQSKVMTAMACLSTVSTITFA